MIVIHLRFYRLWYGSGDTGAAAVVTAEVACISMRLPWSLCRILRRNTLDKLFGLVIKPLVDVGVIARSMLHELVLNGA
jgi:hypothetical protein